jgi:hypothetical protein
MKAKPILYLVALNFNWSQREQEFNKWYNELHVPDVLKAPGVIGATRYEAIRAQEAQPRYLSVYELESEEAIDFFLASPELEKARMDFSARWRSHVSGRSSLWYKPIIP